MKNKFIYFFKNINLTFIFLTIFSFFWFIRTSIDLQVDSIVYLKKAIEFGLDEGDYRRFPYRGPIFTYITLFFLKLSNGSVYIIGLIPRLVGLLILITSYLFLKKLYSNLTALIVFSLILFNPLFNELSSNYHIDLTLSFFILLFLFLFIFGIIQSNFLIIFSGVFYSIAFLTKELALLLIFAPAICLIILNLKFSKIKAFIFFYSPVVFILGYWALYIKSKGHSTLKMFGRHLDTSANPGGEFEKFYDYTLGSSLKSFFESVLTGIDGYLYWLWNDQGPVYFILFLLTIITCLITIIKKKSSKDFIISIVIFSLSPFVIYWGTTLLSPRQLSSFNLLNLIGSSIFINYFITFLKSKKPIRFISSNILKVEISKNFNNFTLLLVLLFFYLSNFQNFSINNPFTLIGNFNESGYNAGKWFSENISSNNNKKIKIHLWTPVGNSFVIPLLGNETIITKGKSLRKVFHPMLNWDSEICERIIINNSKNIDEAINIERLTQVGNHIALENFKRVILSGCELKSDEQILFIWLHKAGRYKNLNCFDVSKKKSPPFGNCVIRIATQYDLLHDLSLGEYLGVDARYYFLTDYFDKHPSIRKIKEFKDSNRGKFKIYKVINDLYKDHIIYLPMTDLAFSDFMESYSKSDYNKFINFKKNFLEGQFNLLDNNKTNTKCFVIKNKTFSIFKKCN